jgi:hypothetical protein
MTGAGPGGKVVAGFFSFTEVTDPGAHREYNEWHQLDHLPEQMPLRGIAFGQRWVASPASRGVRFEATGALSSADYLTIYLVVPPVDEAMRDFFDLAVALHEKERFFSDRRAVTAGPLVVTETHAAPRVSISAAAVPYRPNRGVFVIVGGSAADGAAGLTDIAGVAGTWVFRPGATAPEPPRGAGGRFEDDIVVCYLDGEALETGRSVLSALELAIPPHFAGVFETIIPWQWDWFDTQPGEDRRK